MKCRVDGCDRSAMYKEKQLCQMHYFRIMRNGTTSKLETVRKFRIQNPAGYQKLFLPKHQLSNSDGYIYEHRYVIYEKYGEKLPDCEICGKPTHWETCHIDHVDEDVTNNNIENLRPVCRGCNTFRNYPEQHTISRNHSITYNGKTMTAQEWARQDGINVCGRTIVVRLSKGMSVEQALFSEKKTHKSNTKELNK